MEEPRFTLRPGLALRQIRDGCEIKRLIGKSAVNAEDYAELQRAKRSVLLGILNTAAQISLAVGLSLGIGQGYRQFKAANEPITVTIQGNQFGVSRGELENMRKEIQEGSKAWRKAGLSDDDMLFRTLFARRYNLNAGFLIVSEPFWRLQLKSIAAQNIKESNSPLCQKLFDFYAANARPRIPDQSNLTDPNHFGFDSLGAPDKQSDARHRWFMKYGMPYSDASTRSIFLPEMYELGPSDSDDLHTAFEYRSRIDDAFMAMLDMISEKETGSATYTDPRLKEVFLLHEIALQELTLMLEKVADPDTEEEMFAAIAASTERVLKRLGGLPADRGTEIRLRYRMARTLMASEGPTLAKFKPLLLPMIQDPNRLAPKGDLE